MENIGNVAFYTRDEMFAYDIRNKGVENHMDINYMEDFSALVKNIISNRRGIVILDLKYFRHFKLVSDFCKYRNAGEYKFIYLTGNKEYIDEFDDNVYTFMYDDIEKFMKILPDLVDESNSIYEKKICLISSNIITNIMDSYKISRKYIGFNYLKDCICFASCLERDSMNLCKDVYPRVASMYNTTVDNVEKDIRLALKNASENHPELYGENIFGEGKITSKKFVYRVIDEIHNFKSLI